MNFGYAFAAMLEEKSLAKQEQMEISSRTPVASKEDGDGCTERIYIETGKALENHRKNSNYHKLISKD